MTIRKTENSLCGDWRWLIGLFTVFYILLVTILPSWKLASEQQLLQGLGVPALDHPFMDLRGVAAWCDASLAGKNPAVENTFILLKGDLKPRPNFLMNYSPVVFVLGKLGLSQDSVFSWGVGLALLYGLSLWILCGPRSLQSSLLWLLLICSPASVLAVERGNLDIVLFTLLVVALLVRKHPWAESLAILAAATIKFFPIASLIAPWREKGNVGRFAVLGAFFLFSVFLWMMHSRLNAIAGSLGGQCQSAFGCTTVADLLTKNGILNCLQGEHLRLFSKIAAIASLVTAFGAGLFLHNHWRTRFVSERASHSFFLAAPMMIGLFVLGPQLDYKWIFFLFMVPAALELIRSSHEPEALTAKCWLGAMTLYSYWTFFSDEGSLRNALLKQTLMVIVMILSAFLAGGLWNRKTSQSC